jgi:hypothetical protein
MANFMMTERESHGKQSQWLWARSAQ